MYSRAESGLYIDKTIISEFGLSVYKHLNLNGCHGNRKAIFSGENLLRSHKGDEADESLQTYKYHYPL